MTEPGIRHRSKVWGLLAFFLIQQPKSLPGVLIQKRKFPVIGLNVLSLPGEVTAWGIPLPAWILPHFSQHIQRMPWEQEVLRRSKPGASKWKQGASPQGLAIFRVWGEVHHGMRAWCLWWGNWQEIIRLLLTRTKTRKGSFGPHRCLDWYRQEAEGVVLSWLQSNHELWFPPWKNKAEERWDNLR